MNLLGLITFSSPMSLEKWDSLLKLHNELTPTEAIEIVNPFTQEVTKITSAKKLANVIIGGKTVGALRWCIDDSGIELFGNAKLPKQFASRLATEIKGSFNPT